MCYNKNKKEFLKWKKWKIIDGSNGKYEISNLGRCRKTGTEYYLRINNSYKYPRYRVPGASQYIHRLVAIAFIPNPNNFEVINHIDGDNQNYKYDNLKWGKKKCNFNKNKDSNDFFNYRKIR